MKASGAAAAQARGVEVTAQGRAFRHQAVAQRDGGCEFAVGHVGHRGGRPALPPGHAGERVIDEAPEAVILADGPARRRAGECGQRDIEATPEFRREGCAIRALPSAAAKPYMVHMGKMAA